MSVGKEVRGPLWVDGQFTVRLRGPGPEPGRIIRVRRPFALIGQIPGADIRIDDPGVDGRHAFLLLDRRGIFGVDLLSRSGTRFAGADLASSWLGAGDVLEVAGRRVEMLQLRVDGSPVAPPLSDDDPLADAPGLVGLALEPIDVPGPPWMIGSALAFAGRGDACALRIEHASASMTHCALLRGVGHAHVIDLLGRGTLLNDRPVEGASALLDGDVLAIGQARFVIKLDAPFAPAAWTSTAPARLDDPGFALDLATTGTTHDPRRAVVAMLLEAAGSGRERGEVLEVLRQFQTDTASLFEALNREITSLRQEVRGQQGLPPGPAEPLRLDLIRPPGDPSPEPSSWLLDRLTHLEGEGHPTWKDLLGRIASTVLPKNPPQPSRSLSPTRPGTLPDAPS